MLDVKFKTRTLDLGVRVKRISALSLEGGGGGPMTFWEEGSKMDEN